MVTTDPEEIVKASKMRRLIQKLTANRAMTISHFRDQVGSWGIVAVMGNYGIDGHGCRR